MRRYYYSGIYALMILLISILSITPAFSQGGTPPSAAAAKEADQPKELSIYGEVQSVNAASNSIAVQYYDYDNDEEKTLEISLDKDSKLENVKAIDGIKKGDWADITYTATGGRNIAKMISVETEEPAAGDNAPVDTAAE